MLVYNPFRRIVIRSLLLSGLFLISIAAVNAQELFSATEPASNMASGSIAFRMDHLIMDEINSQKINYHLVPGIRVGITKKLMFDGNVFFSNRTEKLKFEGGSLYAKYRILNNDAVQRHFRLAVFGMASVNNSDIHQEELNLYGHNTGFEAGIVATQLLHKVALSSSVAIIKVLDNSQGNKYVYGLSSSRATNYSFSVGKLMLPKEYNDYRQTNVNLMVETLAQVNNGSGKYYVDVVPTLQLIFSSESRVDIGYRKQLGGNLIRTAPNGFFLRLEHTFFNAF
jgi:hypothetical protein